MANIFGFEVGLGGAGAVVSGTLTIIVVIAIIVIVMGVIAFFIWQSKVYNRKVVVFENIAGRGYQPVFKDRARLVKLGDAGEEVLFLLKKKAYRTAYGAKMGKNAYWFAIGQDGYWYNFVLGDLDAKMGMLDIEPIDRDMRYMHTAIRKNIQDRYQKRGFLERYGTIVMSGIFIVIMLIGIWLLLDKIGEIAGNVAQSVDASNKVVSAAEKIVSSLDNIGSGGSGIRPA